MAGRSRQVRVDAKAWQVLYESTDSVGAPIVVSGTVLVPNKAWDRGPRPIVSYAYGSHGLGQNCAPSYKLRAGTEQETSLISLALSHGWAVAVADGEGSVPDRGR